MDGLGSILAIMGRVIVNSFTSPFFILLMLLMLVITGWQYKRLELTSEQMLGIRYGTYIKSTMVSVAAGLLGGLIGSILLVFTGIDLNQVGFVWLWLIALILMLIQPRFLCFAYAGGVLSLISLLNSSIVINVPALLGLIAILHMVESFLILVSGHVNPIPVYIKKKNTLIGGFNLQKFWPLPLLALVSVEFLDPGSALAMPSWWPLFQGYSGVISGNAFVIMPVAAILGYGEITTTTQPENRVRISAANLFTYSIMLLLLAWLACKWQVFAFIAAFFAPLGHEFVIWLGMREESSRRSIYVKSERGVKVLAVKPDSPAQKAGIVSGDEILSVSGNYTYSIEDIKQQIKASRSGIILEIYRQNQNRFINLPTVPFKHIGIIAVPDSSSPGYVQIKEDRFFQAARKIWHRIK